MDDKNTFWDLSEFTTFGIKGSCTKVEGLTTTINGVKWFICPVKEKNRARHGYNINEKYYLTNDKRDHLSFHKTINEAKKMAFAGGFKNYND